jgi:F0F1-type ATP synthase assembly protein I
MHVPYPLLEQTLIRGRNIMKNKFSIDLGKRGKNHKDENWNEFTNFLTKAVSLNMVFVLTIGLSVYGGYSLGTLLDSHYHFYPMFTLIGTLLGIYFAGLIVNSMVQKYFKTPFQKDKEDTFSLYSRQKDNKIYPVIEVNIEGVRKAVREFADKLPKGV